MKNLLAIIASGALTLGALGGCSNSRNDEVTPPGETRERVAQQPERAETDRATRDRMVRTLEQKIEDTDRQLGQWERDLDRLSGEAADRARSAIDELQLERQRAARSLERARRATSEQWDELERDTERAIDDLEGAYRRAAESMQNEM